MPYRRDRERLYYCNFANNALRYTYTFSTDGKWTRSVGVCGLTIVGPKLIICVFGNMPFNRPHSRPA